MKKIEIWKWITGCEDRYMISNHGRIKSFLNNPKGEIIKFKENEYGYYSRTLRINGNPTNIKIHRWVGLLFIPNPNGYPMLNHLDGNKLNNYEGNLAWTTAIDNVNHAIDTGLRKRSHHQKLSDDDVRKIRKRFEETNISIQELAEEYDVKNQTIYNCLIYKTFSRVDANLFNEYKINTLTLEEFEEKVKPIGTIGPQYVPKEKKTLEERLNVTTEQLKELVHEYVNGTTNISEFCYKHNLKKTIFNKYVTNIDNPPRIIKEGEVFKEYGTTLLISNKGNVFDKKVNRFKIVNLIKNKPLVNIICELFDVTPPENNMRITYLDGNPKNRCISNLKWEALRDIRINKIPKEIIEQIIKDYETKPCSAIQLGKDYSISVHSISRILVNAKKFTKRVQHDKELVDEVRQKYFYELKNGQTIASELDVTVAFVYEVINDKHYPDSEQLEINKNHRKEGKEKIAKAKLEKAKSDRKIIAEKKKKETRLRQEQERLNKIQGRKKDKENLIKEEQQNLLDKGRPLIKRCHACLEEKDVVRDFSKSTNLWDGRANKCKVCTTNRIPIPEIYNMGLPDDHPLVIIDKQMDVEYLRQQKIIDKEREEREREHLKNLTKKF